MPNINAKKGTCLSRCPYELVFKYFDEKKFY